MCAMEEPTTIHRLQRQPFPRALSLSLSLSLSHVYTTRRVQETMPDLDHLLKVFAPAPSSSARSPSSASILSPRASGGSYSHSRQRSGSRRRPPSGSPLAGNMSTAGLVGGSGGGGESLLDVSGISGIAGDNDYNFNDSELFRGGGGGGGGSSGRLNLDGDYGNGHDSINLGGEEEERSPAAWQRPRPGRTSASSVLAPRTAASLGLGRGRGEGQARTPRRSRSPATDSFLRRNGGSGGGSGGGAGGGSGGGGGGYGAGRSGGLAGAAVGGHDEGLSSEWDVRGDDLEGEAVGRCSCSAASNGGEGQGGVGRHVPPRRDRG